MVDRRAIRAALIPLCHARPTRGEVLLDRSTFIGHYVLGERCADTVHARAERPKRIKLGHFDREERARDVTVLAARDDVIPDGEAQCVINPLVSVRYHLHGIRIQSFLVILPR